MANADNRRLAGRYEIRSLIGRGGMAQVHLGFDVRLSRVVAIKMLRPDLARDPIFQTRFRREAQAAASLNHPNIVSVYDTGEETMTGADGQPVGIPYIVMEYVEGHTVKELLSDGTPVPIDEAVEITSGVLSALENAHSAGLVHRDIKPGNVMLTNDGKVKVMDFGIARAMSDSQATMTQTNAVVGTAQYLSPEQARGEQVDSRSDIYSTGCLLFELLTGRPPFQGDSAVAVAYQHVSEVPPAPSSIASDVPESLDRVTMKAMAKDPADRYATASIMRLDMIRAVQGQSVDAPTVASWTAVTAATTPLAAQQTATAVYQGPTRSGGATTPTPAQGNEQLEEKKGKGKAVWITLLVILAIAAIGGTLYALGVFGGSKEPEAQLKVPNVIGMSQEEAIAAIEAVDPELSFDVVVGDPVASEDIDKDKVAKVDPSVGTELGRPTELKEKGDPITITLHLSSGPGSVDLPNMAGWDQQQVRDQLKDLGLEMGDINYEDVPDQPKDKLIRTDPAMGSTLPAGSTVNLYFSTGNVPVPENSQVWDHPQAEVEEMLKALKLNVMIGEGEYDDQVAEGNVIYLSPTGLQPQGTTISIVVSKGPKPPEPEPTPPPNPNPEPSQSGDQGSNN